MTEHTTPDADTAPDATHAATAVDARTGDAVPEPAAEGDELREQIAEQAAVVTTDPAPAGAPTPHTPPESVESEPAAEATTEAPAPPEPEPTVEPEPQPAPPDVQAEAEPAAPVAEEPSPAPDEPSAPSGYEGVADPFAADAQPVGLFDAPSEDEARPAAEDEEEDAPKPAKKPRAPRPSKASAVATPADSAADAGDEPADDAAAAGDSPAEPKPENKKKWYAIKVQSGREDTIKAAILRKVAIEGFEDSFGQIMIPYEEVIEKKQVRVKDKKTGDYVTQEKKVTRKKKKFQGYLFAELEFNDRILYLFRETSGVGDFLNLRGTPPVPEPMSDTEVHQMLTGDKPGPDKGKKVKVDIEKGDRVRIKEGSFKDSEGEVKEVIMPKDPTDAPKIIVEVTFWGRPVPVDLEYWQVAKV